ncbi:stationary phase survival protein SurE [Pedobacter sp. JY14-1]|uniref:stationary phase survival protein SurE n=1 Tax=Pedobacter sp. JY14-1 TaxID=3034151 RepID=UPI0023E1E230|nr:stationary phase survival protein SurE [Pedobacter sp. JY14-1]
MLEEQLAKWRNSVWIGLTAGIVMPGVLISIVWYLMHRFAFLAKADLLLIACVAANAWLMHLFFRFNKDNSGRGVISATFLWAFVFFYYKVSKV